MWIIHLPPKNKRVRIKNLFTHLPGTKVNLREKINSLEVFRHFIDNEMTDLTVKLTNKHILIKVRIRYLHECQAKSTDHVEMEALLVILIQSGVK